MSARRALRATRRRPAVFLGAGAPSGTLRPAPPPAEAVFAAMTEAQFQRIVRAYLTRRGYTVWVFPVMKRTMAGVPDLTFFHPARPGLLWAWELKREKRAVISPAQAAAIAHLSTVPGIDARIVKPSEWPALRDALEGEP